MPERKILGLPPIRWHFSTELAPHPGGVWERMVQLVKRPLIKALGPALLSQTELQTLCKEVEGMVNDRPLAEVSTGTMEAVTPSLLVFGRRLQQAGATSELTDGQGPSEQLQVEQAWRNQVWDAWARQYRTTLQKRGRWHSPQPNRRTGDLVLLELGPKKRHHWPMARVLEVYPGPDSLVRKV